MTWIHIDDDPKDLDSFREMFGRHGVAVESLKPDPDMANIASLSGRGDIDGFLVDYALRDRLPEINVSGTTIAAQLRQFSPDRPIVVFSQALTDTDNRRRYARSDQPIDLELEKGVVRERVGEAVESLQVLASGYATLREYIREEQPLPRASALMVLGLSDAPDPEQATELARRASGQRLNRHFRGLFGQNTEYCRLLPELDRVVAHISSAARKGPYEVARLLVRELMAFPGPLQDSAYAAVALGEAPNSGAPLDEVLGTARYSGVFHGLNGPRYWAPLVLELARGHRPVEPALCHICGGEALTLCASCKQPVDGHHSLPAVREDAAYPTCREVRICGVCLGYPEFPEGLSLEPMHSGRLRTVFRESKAALRERRSRSEKK